MITARRNDSEVIGNQYGTPCFAWTESSCGNSDLTGVPAMLTMSYA